MTNGDTSEPLRFIVLKADRFVGDSIRQFIWTLWPDSCVQVFQSGLEALEAIQERAPDLFVTGLKIADMDGLEHLEPVVAKDFPILIITSHPEPHVCAMLQRVRWDVVFDGHSEGTENLPAALRLALRHQRYISPSLSEFFKPIRNPNLDTLTKTERLVLSVIGDGSDDQQASERLMMAEQTVGAHRKAIMRKLKIHHKGDLMRYALEQGYVVKTAQGMVSPGFQRALEERLKKKKKAAGKPKPPDEPTASGQAAGG